jgi:hypothetical protein
VVQVIWEEIQEYRVMDLLIIRNKSQLKFLTDLLSERRLPFKVALQDIYPIRSVDFNDYLWGFIYTPIAEATGHSPEEVHEECKRKYNFKWDFEYNEATKKYEIVIEAGSTTKLNTKEMWDYAAKIRAEAELELHIILMLPNESFIPELDFEHDKLEEHKL